MSTIKKSPDICKKKTVSRLHSVQALFQMESTGQATNDICREFLDYRFGKKQNGFYLETADFKHFVKTVHDAVNHQAKIDQLTNRALKAEWPLKRIDPTLRALFRAAGAELCNINIPPKVTINEYVDLASSFFPNRKEPGLVNAVLDHMARKLRSEEF